MRGLLAFIKLLAEAFGFLSDEKLRQDGRREVESEGRQLELDFKGAVREKETQNADDGKSAVLARLRKRDAARTGL